LRNALQGVLGRPIRDRQKTREQRLQNRVAAAELTKNTIRDDLKALRDLRDYYRGAARDKQEIYTDLEQAQFGYEAIGQQKKIREVLAGREEARAAIAGALLAETHRILREFSSNVMTGVQPGTQPAPVIHQHFRAPTPDRHREARMAYLAAKAQWLG
jgi:hypothetical protein